MVGRNKTPIIDTFVHFPSEDPRAYDWLAPALGTQWSEYQKNAPPISYLFKNRPSLPAGSDPLEFVLHEMDSHGISIALVDINDPSGVARKAIATHPERFRGTFSINPNDGMLSVRALTEAHRRYGICAATAGPAFFNPQVCIDDKKFYPFYAKCVELDIPICLTAGVPGPRVPMYPQDVSRLDEVCWYFPELKIVMRHGAEPWQALAVKLMLKWPNLFYSTSAFSPRHYPKEIIEFANTRGSDKILFAGYFAVGLTYKQIFSEFESLPLNADVWPKFLHENARRVFRI